MWYKPKPFMKILSNGIKESNIIENADKSSPNLLNLLNV